MHGVHYLIEALFKKGLSGVYLNVYYSQVYTLGIHSIKNRQLGRSYFGGLPCVSDILNISMI